MDDKYVKAKVTVAIEVYVNMADYTEGTTLQEAVAYDFTNAEIFTAQHYCQMAENVFLVGVEEALEDKNETALLAERLSKEL